MIEQRIRRCVLAAIVCAPWYVVTLAHAQTDPLPSWNEGQTKASIVEFVAKVTKQGSPEFVPPAERIAVFDNDGTLWAEQPMYFQLVFALDRVQALAPQHPEWKEKEPFASLLKGDVKGTLAGGEKAMIKLVMATHAGMTPRNSSKSSKTGSPPRSIPRPGGLTPRWCISPCSNCSPTSARTDSRPSSSPRAASSSCARARKRSMASRPNRSSAAASRRSSSCATASQCSCACRS